VARATAEDWNRYYAVADQRRQEIGGDPFKKYVKKESSRQKVLFIGSSLFLVGLVTVLYSVLCG
jgi:hypothetical protein